MSHAPRYCTCGRRRARGARRCRACYHGNRRTPELDARDAEIVRRRRAGESLRQVGRAFGISYERVRQIAGAS